MKILMVCLGNICRSPLAHGIMQDRIDMHHLPWEVDSAGTGGWHAGEAPDFRSVLEAKKHGLDISKQRARKITSGDFELFDLILTMDAQNYNDVVVLTKNETQSENDHELFRAWQKHAGTRSLLRWQVCPGLRNARTSR